MTNGTKSVDVVKVQKNKNNSYINLTKDIQQIFPVEKGEVLKITAIKDKLIVERVKL